MPDRMTQPPTSFFWRDSVRDPLPAWEGDRDILLWAADDTPSQAYSLEPTDGPIGPMGWGARGIVDRMPGERSEGLYWTWADGDPYTRSSHAARQEEKTRLYLTQYMASAETVHDVLEARIRAKLADPTFPKSLGFTGWSPDDD